MYQYDFSRIYNIRLLIRDSWIAAILMSLLALTIHDEITNQNILLSVGIALGYVLAYAVNDYFDAEEDAGDNYKSKHNYWVNNKLSIQFRVFLVLAILLTMFIIFSGFYLKGIVTFSISTFILWAYSVEPLKLRNFPPFDVITHSLFIMSYPYYITLYLLNIEWTKTDVILISALVIGSITIQLENQIRDYEIDLKAIKNTTTVIGVKRSHGIIKLLSVLLIIIISYGFYTIEGMFIYLPYALIYLPIIIQRFNGKAPVIRSEKFIRRIILSMIAYSFILFIY